MCVSSGYSDFILKHWLVPSQTSGELVLPTGHGRVAPISRDDVAAALAAVAAKPNKSRVIYMITRHRALGFGEIAASYGETIMRQVRYRPCSIDKYLTWASARLNDPWPYTFSPPAPQSPKVAIVRSPRTSLPLPAENQRAFEISFFEQRPGVRQIA